MAHPYTMMADCITGEWKKEGDHMRFTYSGMYKMMMMQRMGVGGEAFCDGSSSTTWTCEATMDEFNGKRSSDSKKGKSSGRAPYKLLAISDDYSSYAIKYSCKNDDSMLSDMMGPMKKEFITISSKNQFMDQTTLDEVKKIIEAKLPGYYEDWMMWTVDQNDWCQA